MSWRVVSQFLLGIRLLPSVVFLQLGVSVMFNLERSKAFSASFFNVLDKVEWLNFSSPNVRRTFAATLRMLKLLDRYSAAA